MSETLKVFVGGLSQDTTKASLDAYFGQFGTADSFIMVDKMTGRSRGFGFLNFSDEGVVQQVLACAHEVDGTAVTCSAYSQGGGGRGPAGGGGGGAGGFGGGASSGQLKCFVGGLSQETTKASLDAYFGQFGFADTYVMVDKATGRSRGFGFVNFREENAMNVVLQMQHEIDGSSVNVSAYTDKGGRPGPGAGGISLATGGKGGGGGGTAAVAAAAVAQALQSLGLGGHGGQNQGIQQLVQQAVQQAVGGQASLGGGGGGGGGARGGGGGSGGGPKHLKTFVGGLAQHTTKESMSAYFSQFGQADAFIMMDKASGRSRGFGFVDFQDEQVVQVVLQSAHQIDGQMVNVSAYGGGAGGGGGAPPPQAAAPNLLGGFGGAGSIASLLAGLQGGAKPGRFSPY